MYQSFTARARYEELKSALTSESKQLDSKIGLIANLRLVLFVVMAIATWILWGQTGYIIALIGAGILVFLYMVKWHERIKSRFAFKNRQIEMVDAELKRIEGDFNGLNSGEVYGGTNHAYAYDLDIFGNQSLFQLINRAQSQRGKDAVARLLKQEIGLTEEEVAITRNLEGDIRWNLELSSQLEKFQKNAAALDAFEKDFIQSKMPAVKLVAGIIAVAILIGTMVTLAWMGSLAAWFLPLVIAFSLVMKSFTKSSSVHRGAVADVSENLSDLVAAERLILSNPKVKTLFKASETVNLTAFQKLARYLALKDQPIPYGFLRAFGFELLLGHQLFKSWSGISAHWEAYLNQIARVELVASVAMHNTLFAKLPFAEVGDTIASGTKLYHPLLGQKAVPNDVNLRSEKEVWLITGSNMSGKSTYLRTVALNLVLAHSRCRVMAERLEYQPRQIYTLMRTVDDLQDSTSSFYAELKRLRTLIDKSSAGVKTIFFLDEVLKGTNSQDRHKGAKALILQLQKLNQTGMVSTHDLELESLAENSNGQVVNYHFDSNMDNSGQLAFSYTLKEGACRSFNAYELMKSIGIELS